MLHRLLCRRQPQNQRIIFLGLDCSGKTSLLYRMATGEVATTIPTFGFNVEEVSAGSNKQLVAWDVGGRDKMRPLWRHYFANTDAVAFVVDACDRERLGEVADEILELLQTEELRDTPVAVLCNKSDCSHAMSVPELQQQLLAAAGGDKATQLLQRRESTFLATSAVSGSGVEEAIAWLAARDSSATEAAAAGAGWGQFGAKVLHSVASAAKSLLLR